MAKPKILKATTDIGAPLTDEVRGVMDRLLATDEEIGAAAPCPPEAEALCARDELRILSGSPADIAGPPELTEASKIAETSRT
jgi:hypothetical protein